MAGAHARKSPSGSPAWTLCLAKLHREAEIPDTGDKTAGDRGIICHDLSAKVLEGEHWVLNAAAEGLGNKAIAKKVNLSEHTVADYLRAIYPKLGVKNRTAAAVLAAKAGLV